MTNVQKLDIKRSELDSKRSELRIALIADDNMSAADREAKTSELVAAEKEYKDTSSEWRTAAALQATEDAKTEPADHPKRSVEVREYVESGYYERPLTGAAAEYNKALGLSDEPGVVPIDVILPWMSDEHREDALTPAPSEITENQNAIQQPVRAPTILRELNIATPRVPVGQQNYPRLTTDPTAALVAEGTAQEATAAVFSVSALSPIRLTGAIAWSVEDAASFRGMSDAIQRALQAVVEQKLSDLALNGQASPEVTGLLDGETVANPSDVLTYKSIISQFAGHVDGIRASTMNDLRVLVGVKTWQALVSTTNTKSGAPVFDYLESKLGSLRVESRIAAPASNVQDMLIVRGRATGAVMPIWENARIIRDPYTLAHKGQVRLQIISLVNFAEVNDGKSYVRDKVKLA